MYKVLISDKMSPSAADIFKQRGIQADVITGQSEEELIALIADYDGLVVRSATTVTAKIIEAAKNLKVIGRAGIGTDNIDKEAATAAGVIVMNTPFGNSVTTAEHSFAMMMALARSIPQANSSTHAGKWEKNKYMGVELYHKTLGIIGCGNIGQIVARRALGFEMKVLAYDPFLSDDKAAQIGVHKVALDALLAQSDFMTIHTPLNDQTRGLIDKAALEKCKHGVRIINCARGGIIVEEDLKAALDSGHVAGAALDVFATEPATENPLFGHPNFICTPHLAASTEEAQENVALQVAQQIADYLLSGAVSNALNMPSISAEDAPKLKPYLALAQQLGSFTGQISQSAIEKIEIDYEGLVSKLDVRPLTQMALASILSGLSDSVNMVNARQIAKEKGIAVSETKTDSTRDAHTAIKITVTSESRERDVTGTLFAGTAPRIVNIEGVPIEAAVSPYMLYIRNHDKPGLIGGLGSVLGQAGCNIADFRLGRKKDGSAVALISIDETIDHKVLAELEKLPQVIQVKSLKF